MNTTVSTGFTLQERPRFRYPKKIDKYRRVFWIQSHGNSNPVQCGSSKIAFSWFITRTYGRYIRYIMIYLEQLIGLKFKTFLKRILLGTQAENQPAGGFWYSGRYCSRGLGSNVCHPTDALRGAFPPSPCTALHSIASWLLTHHVINPKIRCPSTFGSKLFQGGFACT